MSDPQLGTVKSTLSHLRAELASAHSRRATFATMTAAAALLSAPRPALAQPTGGTVVQGAAAISQSGSATNINQSTDRAIIDWQGFSVGAGESVNFYQPTNLSVTLNRVIGNERSVIDGALNANGNVFIVNSAGVLFTKNAQVNVGGLVASTLDISNSDFMAGNYLFSGASSAAVVNRGAIRARDGGYVALLGRTVSNEGTIVATLGSIALASGDKITLNFGGDSLVDVTIDKGTYDALVENKGLIKADGGRVVMTAKAADAVLSAQVNNSGIVQARTLADLTGGAASRGTVRIGQIKLLASGGTTKVTGTLDASAPNGGKGGTIETSGNKVTIADAAKVTTASSTGETGSWIIDPDGFTIAASGGDITGAALSSQLESNNVTIASTQGGGSSGDIDVNDAVSWAASTTLTFNATNNININAAIYASGASAGLVLNYGGYAATGAVASGTDYTIGSGGSVTLLGADASLAINGQAYTLIHSMEQLASLSAPIYDSDGQLTYGEDGNLLSTGAAEGYYAIAQNLDAQSQSYVGPVIVTLNGTLAGLGHTIDHLTIHETSGGISAALIDRIGWPYPTTALVRDLGLTNVDISGASGVGGLAGQNYGTIQNTFVTGALTGSFSIGGLVTTNFGTIVSSYTNVSITGSGTNIGGLVGYNKGGGYQQFPGAIIDSVANGTITITGVAADDNSGLTGAGTIGGLVGNNVRGLISGSQANVTVTVTNTYGEVGGLVGKNSNGGSIINSSSTGDVYVRNTNIYAEASGIGGLVGANENSTIDGGRASGSVTISTEGGAYGAVVGAAGGLVGYNEDGDIRNSSATGAVTGISSSYGGASGLGGLVGITSGGSITDSFSSGAVSGQDAGAFVGQNWGTTFSGNSFNIETAGLTNIIGYGDTPDGITSTTTTPSSTSIDRRSGGDFGSASLAGVARVEGARQAAAARAEAAQIAPRIANVLAAGASAETSSAPAAASSATAGKRAVEARAEAKLDDNMKIDEPAAQEPPPAERKARPKRQAVAAAHKTHGGGQGGGFGARIRSIDVDGQHYELNGGGSASPKNR